MTNRFLLIALTASLLLTSCGGTYTCTDPLGCVTVEQGQPITIAAILTLSGPGSPYGVDALRGMELAMQDKGTLLGRPIKLEQQDDKCSTQGGQAAAETLAGMPQVIGVVGVSCSSAATVAAQILSNAGMMLISPSNTAPSLTSANVHQPGFLRTIYNGKSQANLVAEFAFSALGARRMVTIHDGTPDSRELQEKVCLSFVQMGGQCLDQVQIVSGSNLTPDLIHIAFLNPDVIFFPLYITDGAEVVSHLSATGLSNAALISSEGLFNTAFLRQAGKSAQGIYIAASDSSKVNPDLSLKYIKQYGEKPSAVYAAPAYDAAMILFAAIEKTAVQRGTTIYIPRQALRDALFATNNFQGVSGEITCSPLGDCGVPSLKIYQIDLRGFDPIYP